MTVDPRAGKPLDQSELINIPNLITAYYVEVPDPAVAAERTVFGTSGHRGSPLARAFNEQHILAISQAICFYRAQQHIDGPLFLGIDTHALSVPARASVMEVLAANQVPLMLAHDARYTPTPAVSLAIVNYNRGRKTGLADGIVITPSHNPPGDGGLKYNPPHGGPADSTVTQWIGATANRLLENGLAQVQRVSYKAAIAASTTHHHDYLTTYVSELGAVLDMDAIAGSGLKIGVDPLGGAGIEYWGRIADRYGLDLTVIDETVDPRFAFMSADWDGQLRMDPSSAFAMQRLIGLKDRFDVAFACDTDHDRHGIVTTSGGLLPANHYLCVALHYLFQHRVEWSSSAAIGKTVVSSQMIDRIAKKLARPLYEVPVGFKWFVQGLQNGSLGFAGEESAGAVFLRRNGEPWTTDKDGITAALLAAEITARMGHDPGEIYCTLTREFGETYSERVDAKATVAQGKKLGQISAGDVRATQLAGRPIQDITTHAAGNGAAIGGIKVTSVDGWFAARPSGTEDVYKIYAESFQSQAHLRQILKDAQSVVDHALAESP